jgi:hypothetical protein
VREAIRAMRTPPVSMASAYGVPAVFAAQGTIAIGTAEYLDQKAAAKGEAKDPISSILRTEGTASIAAAAMALKSGVAARALRPALNPANATQLTTAARRLDRETLRGSAAVARADNARRVSNAQGQANVAVAANQGRTSLAEGVARALSARGQREAEVARLVARGAAQRAQVRTTTDTGLARVRGNAAVVQAEIAAKGVTQRAVSRENLNPNYKDTWVVQKGKYAGSVRTRKDLSVRTRKDGVSSNDNAVRSAKGA